MVDLNKTIPCPNPACDGEVVINAQLLLSGVQQQCPTCEASFGLTVESKALVQNALNEFVKLSKS